MLKNVSAEQEKAPVKSLLSNIISVKYIAIYIISFMVSMVPISEEFAPFAISFIAACLSNSVPAIGVIAVSFIGSFIKFGMGGALTFLLTTILIMVTFFIIKPKVSEEEGKNEQILLGKNLIISTFIIQLIKCIITGFSMQGVLACITFTIIAYVFYKIFSNSIMVLENIEVSQKHAYTIEEVIGTGLLLAIAFASFSKISILGMSLGNILSIFVVLILGWKNGALVGATSGISIGLTLGVITKSSPIIIFVYIISGVISSILSRFGRIGIAVRFLFR